MTSANNIVYLIDFSIKLVYGILGSMTGAIAGAAISLLMLKVIYFLQK